MSHLLKYSVSINKHPKISSPYSFKRFILKGCSDSKVTWIIGICMLSSPKSLKFKISKLQSKAFMKTGYHIWDVAKAL